MQQYSNLQLFGYLLTSIIFVAIGIFMLDDSIIMSCITILFFGLGIVIFAFQLIKRLLPAVPKKATKQVFPSEIIIERRDPEDNEVLEDWERKCPNHEQFHSVGAIKTIGTKYQWQVFFSAGQYIREEPYESDLGKKIYDTILSTKGVTETGREDAEVFAVDGSPSGEELVQNESAAIDEFMRSNLQKWLDKT